MLSMGGARIMNMTDIVIFVITMWGKTAAGEWEYIGNQYVHQEPMTLTECVEFTSADQWKSFEKNEFYKIELVCYFAGKNDES